MDSETKKLLSGLADSKTRKIDTLDNNESQTVMSVALQFWIDTQDDLLEDDGVEEKAHTKSSRKVGRLHLGYANVSS